MQISTYVNINTSSDDNIMGAVLMNSFSLHGFVPFVVFKLGEVTKSSASIQRLFEYIVSEEVEKDHALIKAPEDWPQVGGIIIKNLKIRYREGLPLVLDNVSFKILAKEKVGIVGRTGSGKSTMLLALTRCLEISDEDAKDGSCIIFDGVDISTIDLHELRKNITIIPQDPFMIKASLRFNVDPFDLYTEDNAIEA